MQLMQLRVFQAGGLWPSQVAGMLLLLAISDLVQAASPDMGGDWVVRIEATEVSNGTPNYVRLTLDQNGSELTGSLPNGRVTGSVEENGEFQIHTPWQVWVGLVEEDEFTASTTSTDRWGWTLSLTASRQERSLSLTQNP